MAQIFKLSSCNWNKSHIESDPQVDSFTAINKSYVSFFMFDKI